VPFEAPSVQLSGILPELILSVAALAVLLVDAFVGDRWGSLYLALLTTAALAGSIVAAVLTWGDGPELQLAGNVALDGFAIFVKVTLAVFGLITVWLGHEYLRREGLERAEFYVLLLFAVAGMMLMGAAADLIVVFIALETFSLALYVLVGFRLRSLASQESAMKYFLLGAFSSTFFLLGIALVYGATGATNLYASAEGGAATIGGFVAVTTSADLGLLVLATGFLIVGLGFKVAAVPFHMWTPDAYQGAPSPVTGFMAAASKLAGFAALLRILESTLYPLRADWRPLLLGVAVATMVVGSVLAVVQEDLKRLLAYSSIAHAGFVLTGVIAANDQGVSGALFYLATYGVTVLGGFAVLSALGDEGERRMSLAEYRGLFFENPLMAGALTLFLLSLAGVPITAGFVGKLLVFGAVIDAGYTWVAVAGVLASAIAAFFYLRVMVVMYMQEAEEDRPATRIGPISAGVIGLAAAATIVFGLAWGPLADLAEKATFFFAQS
jgi:NADH-quinone oxidoreductase subunit N